MPVDVFADLIIDCAEGGEVAPLLETLCELAGGRFVRVHGNSEADFLDDIERATAALRALGEGEGRE